MQSTRVGLLVVLLVTGALLTAGCTSAQSGTPSGATPSGTGTVPPTDAAGSGSLLVYAGAGLKAPLQEIGRAFTEKFGIDVQYTYAGSGVLIAQMNLTRRGDVFIPGSTVEFATAQNQGLVAGSRLVAYHVPVIAVQKGNPHEIRTLRDFAQPGLKVALGDVNATAIGKSGARMFRRLGITGAVEKNVVTRTPTISELTVYMTLGLADAAVLTLDQVDPAKLDAVPIPASENEVLIVPAGTTAFTANPGGADAFAAFVASDEGKAIFAKYGFPAYPDPQYANVTP
jgi:molybdate transport system substrate-binding protein